MEATSRPPMESLPDLPVEEPADTAASGSAARPGHEPTPGAAAAVDTASTQTLLQPEALFVGDDEPTIPGLAEAPPPVVPQVLEVDPDAPLTLDSSFEVDRMLSGSPPPPPPSPAPPPPTLRAAPVEEELSLFPDSAARAKTGALGSMPKSQAPSAPPAARGADAAPPAAPAMVPLARRASISAAAEKLAAAAAAAAATTTAPQSAPKPPQPIASAPGVAPVKPRAAPTGAAASVTPIARKVAVPAVTAPTADAHSAPAPPSPAHDAPSLASWASARAAASASAKTASSTAPRPAAPAAKATSPALPERPRAATPPAATAPARTTTPRPAPAAAPNAPVAPVAPVAAPARGMDRDFIARNQVVDRYFSGKLPIKAATDFERYCKEHPELLDELGLPERVNAGLRLLEASGKPEPWQEAPKPIWQKPAGVLSLAGFALVLAVTLAIVVVGSSAKSRKILDLQRQVADRTLDAATSTRVIRLLPSRSGATSTPAIVIGGGEAKLVDFRIDETRSPYKDFRVTIDRTDQGRVMVIDNLTKDSNGHLRVAVNSSAFGPGNYLLTIEGLTMRLEPQPDSWVTIGIAQR